MIFKDFFEYDLVELKARNFGENLLLKLLAVALGIRRFSAQKVTICELE